MPTILKNILITLGIFAGVGVVALICIFLYNTFGGALTVVWGIAVVLVGLLVTGKLYPLFRKK